MVKQRGQARPRPGARSGDSAKPRVGRYKGGGPKTEDGKNNSKKNSLKHGLCSSTALILPDEDPEEYVEVQRGWREEYQPEGHAENTLVEELISSEWELRSGACDRRL